MPKTTAKIEPRTLKGFSDYPPEQQAARQAMFAKIQNVFERFGFSPLSTPALEYRDVLMGKYGDEEKLIYSFKDNGGRDVAMRYDLTVPLARFVAQNQGKLVFPFKRYQIAPVWRAENTQKGRMREFYQCDVDIVGIVSPVADAEVMVCIYTAFKELGLNNVQVRFNNRMLYYRLFTVPDQEIAIILRTADKVKKIGAEAVMEQLRQQKISAEGLEQAEKLLALGEGEQALENIARLFPAAATVAEAVKGVIWDANKLGIPESALVFDPLTVRGLDYYTNMVFEMVLPDKPEFGSIAGGGRYDGLVDQFSEKSLPAVGGSIGIDRLLEAMQEMGLAKSNGLIKVLVVNQDSALRKEYLEMATQLREAGINTELYYEPGKLDKQFKYAESRGIEYAVIMGAAERERGTVQLKNLGTREQREIPRSDIVSELGSAKNKLLWATLIN